METIEIVSKNGFSLTIPFAKILAVRLNEGKGQSAGVTVFLDTLNPLFSQIKLEEHEYPDRMKALYKSITDGLQIFLRETRLSSAK